MDKETLKEMQNTFYSAVNKNNIDLSKLPSYDPLNVISSMFCVMKECGSDFSWQALTIVLEEALQDHEKIKRANLVDKIEYFELKTKVEEYNKLSDLLQSILKNNITSKTLTTKPSIEVVANE